jgi:hypothetical protein
MEMISPISTGEIVGSKKLRKCNPLPRILMVNTWSAENHGISIHHGLPTFQN